MNFWQNCRDRWVCWWGDQVELAEMRDEMVEVTAQFLDVKRMYDELRSDFVQVSADRDRAVRMLIEAHEQHRELEGQLLVAEAELAANRSSK